MTIIKFPRVLLENGLFLLPWQILRPTSGKPEGGRFFMVIGLPRALLYHRYGTMWRVFFEELGCQTLISGPTTTALLEEGSRVTADESCTPVKIFMGHVQILRGKCDFIFVPRITDFGYFDEMCVRFFGLCDMVRNTFEDAAVLCCNIEQGREREGYLQMARSLGVKRREAQRAYERGVEAMHREENGRSIRQRLIWSGATMRILIAAQPYVLRDAFLGEPLIRLVREAGATPLFSEDCGKKACRGSAEEAAPGLYWHFNKESLGAIAQYRSEVDGVILVSAFPCGTDSLVGEMAVRRIRDVPLIHLLLDEQQGEAGLQTRIESFVDMLRARAVHEG